MSKIQNKTKVKKNVNEEERILISWLELMMSYIKVKNKNFSLKKTSYLECLYEYYIMCIFVSVEASTVQL